MYAVVATGGKQYRVKEGDALNVEKLDVGTEETVSLRPVMIVDDADVTVGADALSGASVTATVVDHHRGPKIRVFKYKNKTGYRRRAGHRQSLTRIRIDRIEA
jgi:large subunit ribosomal protein L21